ncbi:MAG: dihydroneopterin aldolase [Candidatus Dadabacteria bacterium]|nr:dihydroneopterin aldolase [Candidatus Dadabacteria bacterium]NIS09562.1 dihydroneopterin aldolase [Candidatus Dadabacteria bacterium]NIV43071.1 dihydroneopterin aldolase [Candidatus Dadabacteria bacterium]NIX16036.1 dihydroneopterin aldolase [Candidatus Dadabacteria bacterium]NIY22739.1 dihydroneopterin aldolase [Candidatus Dadabacteria bacterium]
MILRIENIRLRTIVGIYEWEKENKQDVVINVELEFDGNKAAKSDNIEDSVNYKTINKEIIEHIENGKFDLIEKIAGDVLDIILKHDKVQKAAVKVDKPGALRFTDSVSVQLGREK